jgi:hypothetical protein
MSRLHSKFLFLASSLCLVIAPIAAVAQTTMSGPEQSAIMAADSLTLPLDSLNIAARSDLAPSSDELTWHDAVTNLPSDWATAGKVVVRPENLPIVLGVGALTGVLVLVDHQAFNASDRLYRKSPFVRDVSDFTVHLGDGAVHAGVAVAFGLYGLVGNDHRALRTASQTLEALVVTGITVQVLKRIAGKESPELATSDRGMWRLFPSPAKYQKNQPKYYAFPSGHIATTMATVTTIAANYPEATWIRPVGYVIVAGVGFSLVNVRYHWYSDLPLGIAIGYMFGKIVARGTDGRLSENDQPGRCRFVLHPDLQRDGGGVTLAMVF